MPTPQKFILTLVLTLLGAAAWADPPARVGQISYVQGAVDFRAAYDDAATPALPNWPLTSNNVIATGRDARVELLVGAGAIRLDADSELEIALLDDTHFRLRLLHGSANVSVDAADLAQDFELASAQGQLTLAAPSQLHIDAGRSPGLTEVSLFTGAGRFAGKQSELSLVAGQRAEVTDNVMQIGVARRNDFDIWSLARDQRNAGSPATRHVSPAVTGYQALDQYGSWSTSADYGAVWYPNAVPAGWAPYQSGRWAWIEPWGWTWVDSAPWGYAPFHYGRWAWFNSRWCWVPGRIAARPVWAPALVGWVGGHNWNARFSAGSAPAVGWFPLAPREVFRPSYVASPTYVRQINVTQVTNVNNIVNLTPQTNFQNRFAHNALTVIPHERFQGRRTVTVANAPALIEPQRQLVRAPLSAMVPATIAHPAPLAATPRSRDNEWRRDAQRPNERSFPARPDTQHQPPASQPHARAAIAPIAPMAPTAPPARAPNTEPAPRQFTAPAERHIQRSGPPVQPPAPVRSIREAPPVALPAPTTPRHEERAQTRGETHPRAMPEQRQFQAPARVERRIEANTPPAPNQARGEAYPQPHREGEARDRRDINRPMHNER